MFLPAPAAGCVKAEAKKQNNKIELQSDDLQIFGCIISESKENIKCSS